MKAILRIFEELVGVQAVSLRSVYNTSFHHIRRLFHFILIFFCINISIINTTKAEETLDTILETLNNLTCETQGVGNLLRTEFTHTCIPASFSTFLIANIISPGLYANTLLRLAINDNELFPGACDRGDRIEFYDQKLSFGLCNNAKLIDVRGDAVSKSGVAIAKSMFTGTDPWDEILNSWDLPKSSYYNLYIDKKEGDEGVMIDVGIIPAFPWKIIKDNDKMCVATQGFGAWIPVGCKYIKEPYPVSIYADFMDLSPEGVEELAKLTSLTTCGNMGSCYTRAYQSSKAPIVMTGPVIECVKEMISKLMISSAVCSFDDVKYVLGSNTRTSSALYQFQKKMHLIVSALLTIYVILFGFKIVLSGDIPPKSELVGFVVKFLFVVYFSVGININVGSADDTERLDGMIQWVFPFLLDGMTQFASWIINSSPSGLCKFNDIEYPPGLEHLQLWDALDCKMSHYLGLDQIQTIIVDNASRSHNFSKFDIFSNPIPPYLYLLIPAILSGFPQLISLVLMYPLLVISIAAFVVNATVVCMISIVVLGVLAPLFVPMYLFNYTRGYFETWAKLLLSFMIQPMVVVVFMTTMLSIYDFGFYGTCKYGYKDFTYSGSELSISIGSGAYQGIPVLGTKSARYFYVDQDWQNSYSTQEEIDGCRNSLGFILNNPFQFLFDTGAQLNNDAVMPWLNDSTGEKDKNRFDFLKAIQSSPGMFFSMVEVIYEKTKTIVLAMLTACLALYLMYHFSESLADFAADMTEGVSIGNIAMKPKEMIQAGQQAVGAAISAVSQMSPAVGMISSQGKNISGALGKIKDITSGKMPDSGGGGGDGGASAVGGDPGKGATESPGGSGSGGEGKGKEKVAKVAMKFAKKAQDIAGGGVIQKLQALKSGMTEGFDVSSGVSSSAKGEDIKRSGGIGKSRPLTPQGGGSSSSGGDDSSKVSDTGSTDTSSGAGSSKSDAGSSSGDGGKTKS